MNKLIKVTKLHSGLNGVEAILSRLETRRGKIMQAKDGEFYFFSNN